MQIQSIQPITYTRKPSFKGNFREINDEHGNLIYRTTTFFFREDLNWKSVAKLLERKYKDVPKVNIINHACSNGTEPYCLAAVLMSELGNKADKFLPISAKDIDPENIHIAKNGAMEANKFDINRIHNVLGKKFFDYFDITNQVPQFADYDRLITPKPILKNKVKFTQSDILKDIDKIPKSNTVLLCRNMWPYLSENERKSLARKLSQHFDDSCLLIIGDYEQQDGDGVNITKLLKENHFYPTKVKNVWHKVDRYKFIKKAFELNNKNKNSKNNNLKKTS